MTFFHVNNGRGRWACADPITASLKTPPIGQERSQAFCPQCQFIWRGPGCLFTTTYSLMKPLDGEYDAERRNRQRQLARARAQGLDDQGNPLSANCWNCTAIRQAAGGYICAHTPDALPVSQQKLAWRTPDRTGCIRFHLRLTIDIPKLGELIPSAVGTVPTPPFREWG